MQISRATKDELALLIGGLRSFFVADQVELQHKLSVQLETELSTRYGLMVGELHEQARYRDEPKPVRVKPTTHRK